MLSGAWPFAVRGTLKTWKQIDAGVLEVESPPESSLEVSGFHTTSRTTQTRAKNG